MSKLKRRMVSATRRGCHPFKRGREWDVVVESEYALGPRGLVLTKRQAVALAYAISISKRAKLVVTFG